MQINHAETEKSWCDSLRGKPCKKNPKDFVDVPIETLRLLVDYKPDTGEFFYKECPVELISFKPNMSFAKKAGHAKRWNTLFALKRAFDKNTICGYKRGYILGQAYLAHRVAWALYYGVWPSNYLDHINGNKSDNRVCNLRIVSDAESQKNRPLQKNNKSGVPGVRWNKKNKIWQVKIGCDYKDVHLGCFTERADAIAARKAGEIEYGYHPNHGRVNVSACVQS